MLRFSPAALLLALAVCGPAAAADYPFGAKVSGSGKPMILIPGLGCDGAVWDTTVAHFKDRYECHVLTPAGFAGQPPVKGPFFDAISAGVARYVRDKKLDKPALVGHSIGATLSFRTAADHPDLFGGVVAVDGFPCIFALFDPAITAEALSAAGNAERAKLDKMTPEEYQAAQKGMFGQWLTGAKLGTAIKWLADADQPTIARAKGEVFAADLRPAVAKITAPVLVLAAYDKGYARFQVTRDVFEERVKAQVAKAKATVVLHDASKHFIMYDQPEWMWKEMEAVLGRK